MIRRTYETGEEFDPSEGLLLAAEVAMMYGVDESTVASWARNGRVPHIRTPGHQFRFSAAWHRKDVTNATG